MCEIFYFHSYYFTAKMSYFATKYKRILFHTAHFVISSFLHLINLLHFLNEIIHPPYFGNVPTFGFVSLVHCVLLAASSIV